MASLTRKVYLSIEPEIFKGLEALAQSRNQSVSDVTKDLVLEALENDEGAYLASLATDLESEDSEKMSYEEFLDMIEKE